MLNTAPTTLLQTPRMSHTFDRFVGTLVSNLFVHLNHCIKDTFWLYMYIDLFILFFLLLLSRYTYVLLKQYKNELTVEFLYLSVRNIVLISLVCLVGSSVVLNESLPLSLREGVGYASLILSVVGVHQSRDLIWGWVCFIVKHLWILFILFLDISCISLVGYILS